MACAKLRRAARLVLRMPKQNAGQFVCPNCRRRYGDSLYHGPDGHAHPALCMDCWADEWVDMEVRLMCGGDWTVLDSALWLVCCGFTRQQAAGILGLHRNTIHNWIARLRRNPSEIPDWLMRKVADAAQQAEVKRNMSHGRY